MEKNPEVSTTKPGVDVNDFSHFVRKNVVFKSKLDSDPKGTPAKTFRVQFTFESVKQACECGERFVKWACQEEARQGNLPPDTIVTVDIRGKIIKSKQEQISSMSAKEMLETMRLMQEEMQRRAKAEMEAGLPEKEDEFSEEELDELTNPGNNA
jgi:hypothetical protein